MAWKLQGEVGVGDVHDGSSEGVPCPQLDPVLSPATFPQI